MVVSLLMGLAASIPPVAAAAEVDDSTSEIEALVSKGDFDAAERAARKLLQSGSLARRAVARVYLQLGIVAAARRDSAGAREAFRNALRLDSALTLHPSVGPHVAEAFARVRASMPPEAALVPEVALNTLPGRGELTVEAAARPADDELARRLSVRIADLREARDLGPEPIRFTLPLPGSVDQCATVTASVLDQFGNELWPAVVSKDVCRPAPAAPVSFGDDGPARPTLVAPRPATPPANALSTATTATTTGRGAPPAAWITAAMTGAAAAATAVLGVVALERRDDYDRSLRSMAPVDQSRQLKELALTAEHRASAGGIVTGALAVTSVVLFIRGRF
jgi:hypothetical protein